MGLQGVDTSATSHAMKKPRSRPLLPSWIGFESFHFQQFAPGPKWDLFGKDPVVANSFVCTCLGGKLFACSNNGNGKWALLAAENLIFLVAING